MCPSTNKWPVLDCVFGKFGLKSWSNYVDFGTNLCSCPCTCLYFECFFFFFFRAALATTSSLYDSVDDALHRLVRVSNQRGHDLEALGRLAALVDKLDKVIKKYLCFLHVIHFKPKMNCSVLHSLCKQTGGSLTLTRSQNICSSEGPPINLTWVIIIWVIVRREIN